jgi:hypothetical protein
MTGTVIVVIIVVVVAVALVASFFVRRHGESNRPDPGWKPTDEVFRDPGTDRLMRVWIDQTGERHYVAEARR